MVGECTRCLKCKTSDSVLKLFNNAPCVFAENRILPTEVRKDALELQKLLEYDDTGAEGECFALFFKMILGSSFLLKRLCSILPRFVFVVHSQVSVHTWTMSISGLELRTQKSWSLHPETRVPD